MLPGAAARRLRALPADRRVAGAAEDHDAEVVHHDEHLFQAVHQTSELWLKFACGELDGGPRRSSTPIGAAAATRLVRRACDAMLFIHQPAQHAGAHVAVAITPWSGPRWGTAPASTHPLLSHARVRAARLASRSSACSTRSLSWSTSARAGAGTEVVSGFAEQLITWDERAILWRFQHLKTVERIIGGNIIGTQGTPVDVLGKRIDVRFFPALWLVRDEITRRSALGTDGHGH